MKHLLSILIILCGALPGYSQQKDSVGYLDGIQIKDDTIPHREIPPVYVFPRKGFKSKRYERRYSRLVEKVKKVYPYAKRANELLKEYNVRYEATQNKKLRRQYVKQAEKELFSEYGPQLKKLKISEGRILIKLIDRETGSTSYQLIKELKGGLTAFFWQGIARIFGNNLKDEFDPYNEDRMIEEIVFYIEAGLIK